MLIVTDSYCNFKYVPDSDTIPPVVGSAPCQGDRRLYLHQVKIILMR